MKSDTAFQKINSRIISLLEEDIIPWRKPFDVSLDPMNGASGHVYDGVNAWFLRLLQFEEPFFFGFKQVNELDGKVRKGETGIPIRYPQFYYRDQETGKKISASKANKLIDKFGSERVKTSRSFGYSNVWNIAQCDNINRDELPELSSGSLQQFDSISACEQLINGWKDRPEINRIHGDRAAYYRQEDSIKIPEPQYFESQEEYYAVLFHEMTHATGSTERLDRTKGKQKGDQDYCFEELVAEIGAAYLCGHVGIEKPVLKNKAAYIQGWLSELKKDENNDWILKACGQAEKAAKLIIGEEEESKEQLKKAS